MRRTLDTNICSYILRRHPQGMIERFATLDKSQV
jgi:tRNA(fMet)-specific endonuclease VapC